MECVSCGLQSAYNRAVVDTVSERQLGVLCPECESEYFGRTLEDGEWNDDQCALCHRDGFFALPTYRAYLVETDGRSVSRSEYSLAAPSPALCDTHFHQVTEASPSATPDTSVQVNSSLNQP